MTNIGVFIGLFCGGWSTPTWYNPKPKMTKIRVGVAQNSNPQRVGVLWKSTVRRNEKSNPVWVRVTLKFPQTLQPRIIQTPTPRGLATVYGIDLRAFFKGRGGSPFFAILRKCFLFCCCFLRHHS